MPHFVPLYYIDSYIWFPSEQEILRNNSFPPDSILSQIIFIWLLWEGIYICKRNICSWMIKVGNNSFLQTQFGLKASETISQRRFCQNYSYVKERFRIKVGNDSFLQSQFGPKASETISQRRFLLKIKLIHIFILSYSLNSVRKRLKRFLREGFC